MTDYKISHQSYKVEKVVGENCYYHLEGVDKHPKLTDVIFIDRSDPYLDGLYKADFFLLVNGSDYRDEGFWLADMYETEIPNVFCGSITYKGRECLIISKFILTRGYLTIDLYDNCSPTKSEFKLILDHYK